MEAVTLTNISKRYGSVEALRGVSLSVAPGELFGIIGPDGAGKTSLFRILTTLLLADGGSASVCGLDVVKDYKAIRRRVGYMPGRFSLYPDLTVEENLNFFATVFHTAIEENYDLVRDIYRQIEPFRKRRAGALSGGMKQKLGLACTLVRSPDLLLLDEPTVGVDPLSRRELWDILKEFVKEEHLSIFVSTAYMNEAEMCRHVFVLNKGRILADGTPEDLRNLARGRTYRVMPEAGMPTRILQAHLLDDDDHVVDAVPRGGEVHFIARKQGMVIPCLEAGGLKAEADEPRLEDGFMILLRKAEPSVLKSSPDSERALDEGGRPSEEVNIRVKNLVKKFGDFTAVANTSFEVHKGEIFGLLGPNGAGKTTTFKMLCGLLPETSGFLSVAGVDLRKARTRARANIGYVAQKFSLYSHMTVRENLNFFGGLYGLAPAKKKERIREVVKEFHLENRLDMKAGDLPGGYKQRLSMACALIHEPKILFLDEPTSGIDPLARRNFWRQITTLAARGTTIIITTHFMEEAEYCDRFMIQDNGQLLAIGSPSEIRRKLKEPRADMDDIFIKIVDEARKKGEKNPWKDSAGA